MHIHWHTFTIYTYAHTSCTPTHMYMYAHTHNTCQYISPSSGMGVTVTKQYPPTTTPHGSTSRLPLALNGLQSGSRQSLHQAPDAPGTELNRTESQSRSVSRQSQGGGARSSRASQVSDHAPRGEESDASTLSPRDLSVHSHANGEAEGSVLPS